MTKATVTFLLDQLRFGGAERALVYLARGFADDGYDVDFLIRNRRCGAYLSDLPRSVNLQELPKAGPLALRYYLARKLPELMRSSPQLVFGYRSLPMAMRLLPGLVDYLQLRQPAALLTTMPQNNLLALWARRIAAARTRIVIREANCFSRVFEMNKAQSKAGVLRAARHWYREADAIVAVSDGIGSDLANTLHLPKMQIKTIYNPVDMDRISGMAEAGVPHPWFEDDRQPVLVTVGRLTQQKDHKTLLHALQHINRHRPARLIIVGEGGLKDRLQEEATALGLEGQVHWAGTTENPYAYIARADVLVLSSAWEGLPNVLLEALACRTPVVSTDADGGGPAELLQHGRFGRIVPVGSPIELAEAISQTLKDPGNLEAAYNHVQEFSMERSVREYLSVMLPVDQTS